MARHDKRGRSPVPPDDQFVALRNGLRESSAWRSLGYLARLVYIEVAARCIPPSKKGPGNNGSVEASVRYLAAKVECSKGGVEKALAELVDRGFLIRRQRGHLDFDGKGRGSLWQLTEHGTATQPRPLKSYLNWTPAEPAADEEPAGQKTETRPTECDTPFYSVGHSAEKCPTEWHSSANKGEPECPTQWDNLTSTGWVAGASGGTDPAGPAAMPSAIDFATFGRAFCAQRPAGDFLAPPRQFEASVQRKGNKARGRSRSHVPPGEPGGTVSPNSLSGLREQRR